MGKNKKNIGSKVTVYRDGKGGHHVINNGLKHLPPVMNDFDLRLICEQAADVMHYQGSERAKFVRVMMAGLVGDKLSSEEFKEAAEMFDMLDAKLNGKTKEEIAAEAPARSLNYDIANDYCGIRSWEALKNAYSAHKEIFKSFYCSCVSDTLLEVLDMLCQQAVMNLSQASIKVDEETRHFLNTLKARMSKVRETTRYRLRDIMTAEERHFGDAALDDADWLKDIILLVIDRVGDDPENRVPMVKRAIMRMKSQMNGMYDEMLDVDRLK